MSKPSEQRRRAYEAGFRGDPMPDWAAEDPELVDAFDRGLNDGEDPVGAATRAGSDAGAAAAGGGTSTKTRARKSGTRKQAHRSTSSSSTPAPSTSSRPGAATPPGGNSQRGDLAPSWGDVKGARVGGGVTVDDGAGFLLGLFVFALGRAFLVGGSSGAKQWLAAKFLNRAGKPAAAAPGAGSSATSQGDYTVPSAWNAAPATPNYPAPPWTPTTPSTADTSKTAIVPGNFGGQQ